ncbi:MAG: dihydrofolate reductase [Casimicrobiaceae bacterium]
MTPRPALAIIAAVARNGVIGVNGGLPWRLPADLRRFRELTTGHSVIMGRRTWESLGRALPQRQNIVISRQARLTLESATVVPSLAAALAAVAMPEPAFCIGGGELYREALARADTVFLTEIGRDFEGDVVFPPLDERTWEVAGREPAATDAREGGGLSFRFVTYRRRCGGKRVSSEGASNSPDAVVATALRA